MILPQTKIVNQDDLSDILDKSLPLFFDTETDGLYGTIQLAQFYQPHLDTVFFVKSPDPLSLALLLKEFLVVGHNLAYDLSCIQNQLGRTSLFKGINIFDTFYSSRLIWPTEKGNRPYSLKCIHEKVFPYNVYEQYDVDVKLAKKVTDWNLDDPKERLYSALDVFVLDKLYEATKQVASTENRLYNIYKLDIKSMLIALDFQCNGYPFLPDRIHTRIEEIAQELKLCGVPSDVNVNSVKQVKEHLNVQETNKKYLMVALAEIFKEQDRPKVKAVLKKRSLLKEDMFLRKWLRLGVDNVLYGHLMPNTRGGRFNSQHENLQNIPRKAYHMFGIEKDNPEDEVLIYSDYSQLELRTFAAVVGDHKMAQAFKDNVDIHTLTTVEMFNKHEPTDDERFLGKCCNFLLLYGGGAEVLFINVLDSGKFVITRDEAQEYQTKFLTKAWPKVNEYKIAGIKAVKAKQIWYTILGRPYVGERLTDHLNTKVQGSGADIAKLALHFMTLDTELFQKYNVKIRNFIHDAYVLTCKKSGYKEVAEHVGKCMHKAWVFACEASGPGEAKIKDIPMPVDVLVGYNVGDMKKDYLAKLDVIDQENLKWSTQNEQRPLI